MKKPPFYLAAIIIVLLSITPHTSKAALGSGEIFYEWISDSTYRIFFRGYFECTGTTEPATMPLCISNSCTSTVLAPTMTLFSSNVIPASCPSYPTKCTLPSSSIVGYKAVIYSVMVTLPARCNSWKFSVTASAMPTSVNLSSGNFYVEAVFNNTGTFQGNSSPYFTTKPVQYVCNGSPYSHNSGAVDANGDSLVTEIINVRTNSGCPGTPASTTFASTTPTLSIPSNPFQTNNTTTINTTTGQMNFIPGMLGNNIAALRVKEYRNGLLIGSVMHQLAFEVMNCSTATFNTTTPFSLTNCYLGTGGRIEACIGIPFSFSVDIKSTDTSSNFIISSNNTFSTPGSTVTYGNQGQDSIRVTYLWTAPVTSVGLHNVIFTIKDSSCKAPGIIMYYTVSVPIFIWPNLTITQDTTICLGKSVSLLGGNVWSILSGTPGSLSCTTCTNPIATPTITSVYTTNTTTCPNFKDTVTIGVNTNITTPTISISANPGTTITSGTSVTFTAATTGCSNRSFLWRKNGATVSTSGSTYTSSSLINGDIITCQLACNDSCPNPKTTNSNSLTMNVTTGIKEINPRLDINIYPNPNTGSFTLNGNVGNNETVKISVINSIGQVLHRDIIKPENHQLNIQLNLQLPQGIYILKLDNQTIRFTVSN